MHCQATNVLPQKSNSRPPFLANTDSTGSAASLAPTLEDSRSANILSISQPYIHRVVTRAIMHSHYEASPTVQGHVGRLGWTLSLRQDLSTCHTGWPSVPPRSKTTYAYMRPNLHSISPRCICGVIVLPKNPVILFLPSHGQVMLVLQLGCLGWFQSGVLMVPRTPSVVLMLPLGLPKPGMRPHCQTLASAQDSLPELAPSSWDVSSSFSQLRCACCHWRLDQDPLSSATRTC